MRQPVLTAARRLQLNKGKLLFLNGILCMLYPLCYTFLILLPKGEGVYNVHSTGTGIVVTNLVFLLILLLNLNTLYTVFSLSPQPRALKTRVAFFTSFTVWSFYILMTFCFILFVPGFLTRFHHFVTHSFRPMQSPFIFIMNIFGAGLGYLSYQYYEGKGMKQFGVLMVFVIFLFCYKLTVPYFLYLLAWVFFAGFHFCLYYEIVDRSRFAQTLKIKLFTENNPSNGLIHFEQDMANPL